MSTQRWEAGDGPLRMPPVAAEGWSARDREETADFVVVGSGPGGSAVARVLAQSGARVLVLEEGPPEQRFGLNQAQVMRHHMQEGGAMVARGNAYTPIAAGRGVGGGSLINSAIAWRCPDGVLGSWVDLLRDDRFAPARMGPVYDELWELLGIWSTRREVSGRNNDLIVRGVQALGLDGGYLERATPGCVGCGVCYFGCPSLGKASTNTNLLVEAVAAGARILADTKVDAFLLEGDRVVGVAGTQAHPDTGETGGRVTVRAGQVVVCAGGIGTPRLLHHAGIAERLGPAVGEGLHVHPGNAVLGLCDTPIELWRGATQGAYFHVPEDPGILPHTFSAPPEACLGVMRAVGPETKTALAELARLCGLVVMISDKGSGRVRAFPDGRADISYTFDDADMERIRLGMRWAAKVLLAGGAREVFAPVHGTGRYTSAEALYDALAGKRALDYTMYAAHPMSTCRMGRDPATSVVGPDGRTHALAGLAIADSSIFPTSLGVNPSITTMAMATVLARGWVGA